MSVGAPNAAGKGRKNGVSDRGKVAMVATSKRVSIKMSPALTRLQGFIARQAAVERPAP
jgi:hypothetical protein